MVTIQPISQIESVEGNDMRLMLTRNQVRPRESEHCIAGSSGFRREQTILILRHNHFRIDEQTLVSQFQTGTSAQRTVGVGVKRQNGSTAVKSHS